MTTRRAATIATRIFEPEGGAAAYRLGALARALEEAGFTTTVLTTQTTPPADPRPRVRRWPVVRDRGGAVRGYLPFASFDAPLFFRLLFGPRADVVVVEPPPTSGIVTRVACWLRRTPYVYFSADVMTTALKGMGASSAVVWFVERLERASLRGAVLSLAVSPAVAAEVRQLGMPADRVAVVGTGIDTARFTPAADAPPRENPYLIYTGMMSEFQGAAVFIEAFARVAPSHPDASLEMFGTGVEVEELTALAERLAPGRIRFHGTVEADALLPWLRHARAGLASIRPGLGYDFAFPTKALASTGCGTPVLYAGVGPVRELVSQNDLGWAVDWEVDAVAAAMHDALSRTPDAATRARLAQWTAQNYSLAAVAERAVTAIRRAIGD